MKGVFLAHDVLLGSEGQSRFGTPYMFWIPSGLISMVSDDLNIVAASLKAKVVNSHKPAFKQGFYETKARTNN